MKIHETRNIKAEYVDKKFGDIPGGTVFMYHGACYVKVTENLYKTVSYTDNPLLEQIHAIAIGTINGRNTGRSIIFNMDSVVRVYPNAATYLLG